MLDALCDNVFQVEKTQTVNEDPCNQLLFCHFCKLLETASDTSGVDEKFKVIFNTRLSSTLNGTSVYPLLRLLVPIIDTERGKYGIKENTINKVYINALNLNKNTEAAQKLIHWNTASATSRAFKSKNTTDFASILYNVLQVRINDSNYSTKTIKDVNTLLDEIAKAESIDEKKTIIKDKLIKNSGFCAIEQKWLMRIIFQDLKIGLSYEQVLKRFYDGALERYNECSNLRKVCEEQVYRNSDFGLSNEFSSFKSNITLFQPCKPMLAKGFSKNSYGSNQVKFAENAMSGNAFIMDVKLDGERMMVHIKNNDVRIFSRASTDYTSHYKCLAYDIKRLVKYSECILDGEVCTWDRENECFSKFGTNSSAASEETYMIENDDYHKNINEYVSSNNKNKNVSSTTDPLKETKNIYLQLSKHLIFIVFDILYLNGNGTYEIVKNALQKFDCDIQDDEKIDSNDGTIQQSIIGSYRQKGELIHMPLAVRREILKYVFHHFESHRVEMITYKQVNEIENTAKRCELIEEYFNEITLQGEEGLVIKNLSSIYELGGNATKRLEFWVKMKPEYGDMVRDLDVVILAGYYSKASNYRGNGLSTFLYGVKDPYAPGGYVTLGKVGSGYKEIELQEIRKKLDAISQKWPITTNSNSSSTQQRKLSSSSLPLPLHLSSWKIGKPDDCPNVWFPPEESIVIELKCAELVDSTQYSAGMTCRFPRVNKLRFDKQVNDIMSIDDIRAIRNAPRLTTHEVNENRLTANKESDKSDFQKNGNIYKQSYNKNYSMTNSHIKKNLKSSSSQFEYKSSIPLSSKRKKGGTSIIDSLFQCKPSHPNLVRSKGNIFHDCIFCIIGESFHTDITTNDSLLSSSSSTSKTNLTKKYTRQMLIDDIYAYGGEVTANPELDCLIIIDPEKKNQLNIKIHIEQGLCDIISCSYIIECLYNKKLLPLTSQHYISYSKSTKNQIRNQMDPLGDKYSIESSLPEIMHILNDIYIDSYIQFIEKTINQLDIDIVELNKKINKCNKRKSNIIKRQLQLAKKKDKTEQKHKKIKLDNSLKTDHIVELQNINNSENQYIEYLNNNDIVSNENDNIIDIKKNETESSDIDSYIDNTEVQNIDEEIIQLIQERNALLREYHESHCFLQDHKNLSKEYIIHTSSSSSLSLLNYHIDNDIDNIVLWHELGKHMDDEERQLLDVSWNFLFQPNVVFFVDMGQDFGSLQPCSYKTNNNMNQNINSQWFIFGKALQSQIKLYGGQVSNHLHVGVSHIVIQPNLCSNPARIEDIQVRLRLLRIQEGCYYEKKLVTSKWLRACMDAKSILEI